MPVTKSPLRYPGGKTQLSDFLKNTIKLNNFNETIYCEPFAGGFGAGIELLDSNFVDSVIINDFDIGIYSIWYAILNDLYKFVHLIESTPITIEEWQNQKEIYEELRLEDEYSIDLAFATFFLNRTNHSGIISGGPIGGRNQTSKYLIDCRFNKTNLIDKINIIHNLSDRIELYNLEANDLIKEILLFNNPENLFIFFDPPYYKQGKNLYTNFFTHDNHVELKEHIDLLNEYKWILTYDYEENINDIYQSYNTLEYRIHYSANRVRKEKEYLFHNHNTLVESFDSIQFE